MGTPPPYQPHVGDRVTYGLPGIAEDSHVYVVSEVRAGDDGWFDLVDEANPRYFTRHSLADLNHYAYVLLARDVPVPPKQATRDWPWRSDHVTARQLGEVLAGTDPGSEIRFSQGSMSVPVTKVALGKDGNIYLSYE